MSGSKSGSVRREESARQALAALGSHRSDHQQLSIQCRHAHHVAAVYRTEAGPVYVARTGPHSHGRKDFIDSGRHGGHGGGEYVDLLTEAPSVDEELPAWCDCGPRILLRRDVLRHVAARRGPVRLE